ncbi:TetR-like C-terminal domain-containing protein [Neobacillus sp. PS3-34]|uniref:TetR-like C-terminal domain-containing protein n=1 Tax=Neobacillus sp. PS3-34 TaxID=3070678 RepID=UPI0027E0375D|nr:TetR-like C-terminal domain-containing protein [Neobacillus sp. PS3-34]WML49966.1 TetR-like C-terminal domain-containing protein [Neobacillus sp. PS3-34]
MSPRPKTALDLNTILKAAADIADGFGLSEVTLTNLAKKLNIRPPSLYNHFEGLPGLREKLAIYGINQLYTALAAEAIGVSKEEAVMRVGRAYVDFARNHPGIYEATLSAPNPRNKEVQLAGNKIVDLALRVLQAYSLEEEAALHAVRGLRSILHGFASLEQKGGFGLALDTDLSLNLLIKSFLAGIDKMNGR